MHGRQPPPLPPVADLLLEALEIGVWLPFFDITSRLPITFIEVHVVQGEALFGAVTC